MKFTIRGDFAKLEAWEEEFASTNKVLEVMARDMAEEALDLVKEGWSKQADPYGKRWKGKKRPDGRQVLIGKTARLKGGWHVRRSGRNGFTISPSVDYAGYHQTGTKFAPQRAMVPFKSRGLPKPWRAAFEEIAEDHLAAHFGSKKAARMVRSGGRRSVSGG
ncbi:MAG TPA: hypothetical protein VGP93_09920 [Polyangiaceae bacterium]|jgi:phage gpG-like protein|nr:hypothetical protein [Polyangiaceae bacterium]